MTPLPIFVLCRDRLEVLQRLTAWLERAGHERIIYVDIQSTYSPLLEWFEASPHVVARLDANLGHRAAWASGVIDQYADSLRPYVVTDCDVVPTETCPPDAVDHLANQLAMNQDLVKVGLSLRTDDLPAAYARRQEVLHWESRFSRDSLSPTLWRADVDTTFAVYRPGIPYSTGPAARTKTPYVARHLPWYSVGAPTADEEYYLRHARLGDTTWNLATLPAWLQRDLDGRGPQPAPGPIKAKVLHLLRTRRWR